MWSILAWVSLAFMSSNWIRLRRLVWWDSRGNSPSPAHHCVTQPLPPPSKLCVSLLPKVLTMTSCVGASGRESSSETRPLFHIYLGRSHDACWLVQGLGPAPVKLLHLNTHMMRHETISSRWLRYQSYNNLCVLTAWRWCRPGGSISVFLAFFFLIYI